MSVAEDQADDRASAARQARVRAAVRAGCPRWWPAVVREGEVVVARGHGAAGRHHAVADSVRRAVPHRVDHEDVHGGAGAPAGAGGSDRPWTTPWASARRRRLRRPHGVGRCSRTRRSAAEPVGALVGGVAGGLLGRSWSPANSGGAGVPRRTSSSTTPTWGTPCSVRSPPGWAATLVGARAGADPDAAGHEPDDVPPGARRRRAGTPCTPTTGRSPSSPPPTPARWPRPGRPGPRSTDLARWAAFLLAGHPDVLPLTELLAASHPQAGDRHDRLHVGTWPRVHAGGRAARACWSGTAVRCPASWPAASWTGSVGTGAVILANGTTGLRSGELRPGAPGAPGGVRGRP